jgi:hypothetical protein
MRDSGRIIFGVVVFLGVVTFPVWHTLGRNGGSSAPKLELPKDSSRCVEETAYMRAHHMELLDEWRDEVVREGKKEYTSSAFGTNHEMSLTKTCMGCHTSREKFCAECHAFVSVEPTCWNCHLEPKGN